MASEVSRADSSVPTCVVEKIEPYQVEFGLFRPARYLTEDWAPRAGRALRNGGVVILEAEGRQPQPWNVGQFNGFADAIGFLVAARRYMALDMSAKTRLFPYSVEFGHGYVTLPGKECLHLSKSMVNVGQECAAMAAFQGFQKIAKGLLIMLQASGPNFNPGFDPGPGVYTDVLQPLIDDDRAGHLLSIFSYSCDHACVDHIDRGLLTLVTNVDGGLQVYQNGNWMNVPRTNGLVAFAGHTLEVVTHGQCPAVPHRICRSVGRLSLAFKLRAPLAAEINIQGGGSVSVGTLLKPIDSLRLSINAPHVGDADLQKLTVASLKARCKDKGLKVSGNKQELVRRLGKHIEDASRTQAGDTHSPAMHLQSNSSSAVSTLIAPTACAFSGRLSMESLVSILNFCEFGSFLAYRGAARIWHRQGNQSMYWLQFCMWKGIPWLQHQADWGFYVADWQQQLYIWHHSGAVEVEAIMGFLAPRLTGLRPASRAIRLSKAVEDWGLSQFSEFRLFRAKSERALGIYRGTGQGCIGTWNGLRLCKWHKGEDLAKLDFNRHGGTTWDPFLGELGVDKLFVQVVLRGD